MIKGSAYLFHIVVLASTALIACTTTRAISEPDRQRLRYIRQMAPELRERHSQAELISMIEGELSGLSTDYMLIHFTDTKNDTALRELLVTVIDGHVYYLNILVNGTDDRELQKRARGIISRVKEHRVKYPFQYSDARQKEIMDAVYSQY